MGQYSTLGSTSARSTHETKPSKGGPEYGQAGRFGYGIYKGIIEFKERGILPERERNRVGASPYESNCFPGVVLCWKVQQIQPGHTVHFDIEFVGNAGVVPQPPPTV